jgi:hypothetical protein
VHPDWKAWHLLSSRQEVGRFHRRNDAAEKRNLGLSVGSVLGWRWILFMDDDIYPAQAPPTLDPDGFSHARAVLAERRELRAIGWSASAMEDHSVIGHARKLVGMKQDVFVGTGALLVRCDENTPFFAHIYNHDWLFLCALAVAAPYPYSAIGRAGYARQLPYDPFVPGRARSEEAGDLIGESLFNLLELFGADCRTAAGRDYWDQALTSRRSLIVDLITRIGRKASKAHGHARDELLRVQRALVASHQVASSITGSDLDSFVNGWRSDQKRWTEHLLALRQTLGYGPVERRILDVLRSGKPPSFAWPYPSLQRMLPPQSIQAWDASVI